MKVIFLDIDGVLNVISHDHDEFGSQFHKHFVENLRRIIHMTGAKIVISSSWRKNGLEEMQAMWKHRNYPGEVIDVTPSLYLKKGGGIQFWNDKIRQHPTPKIHGYSIPRGAEIEYWLKNEAKEPVESYVILDDDTDMLLSQKDNFICCSGNQDHEDCIDIGYGLTRRNAFKAIYILNIVDHDILAWHENSRFDQVWPLKNGISLSFRCDSTLISICPWRTNSNSPLQGARIEFRYEHLAKMSASEMKTFTGKIVKIQDDEEN